MKKLLVGRAPPWVYALWAREKSLFFKLDILMSSHKLRVDEPCLFGKVFNHSQEDTKNLLVEFYLHGLILPNITHLNLNLLIGDIHLRVLCSIMKNKVKRESHRATFEELELNHPLTIIPEHTSMEEINLDI